MEDKVLEEIKNLATKYGVERVVLFGSRARGDNSHASDYDIAIYGKSLTSAEKAKLSLEIEEIETLKKIDVIFVGDNIGSNITESITREGVIIYE